MSIFLSFLCSSYDCLLHILVLTQVCLHNNAKGVVDVMNTHKKSVGELLRSMRKERGLTQVQLSRGICSRTTLATIETNNSSVNIDLLEKLLSRMNIDLYELQIIRSNFSYRNRKEIYKELQLKYVNGNISLEKLQEEMQENYKKNGNIAYLAIFMVFAKKILQEDIKTQLNTYTYEAEHIKKYFKTVTQYTNYEISIMASCLFLFGTETILMLIGEWNRKINKKNHFSFQAINNILVFYFNAIQICLERKDINEASKILKGLQLYDLDLPNRIYYRLMEEYYRSLIVMIVQESPDNNIKRIYDFFLFLGYKKKAEVLKKNTENLCNLNKCRDSLQK